MFSKAMIKKWLGLNAIVLYPPVNIEKYLPLSRNKNRENIATTVDRIEKAKT